MLFLSVQVYTDFLIPCFLTNYVAKDCQEIYDAGNVASGVYYLKPEGSGKIAVLQNILIWFKKCSKATVSSLMAEAG